jgi:hypothetical protein
MQLLRTLILVSLLVFVAALLAGGVLAGLRALSLWRTFRRFRRRLDAELGELSVRLSRAEKRLAGLSAQAAVLDDARVRLQDSLATAATLARASAEAWALVSRVRALIPSK